MDQTKFKLESQLVSDRKMNKAITHYYEIQLLVTPSLKGLTRAAEIDLNYAINNINSMLQ